jgi:hypothetical protein
MFAGHGTLEPVARLMGVELRVGVEDVGRLPDHVRRFVPEQGCEGWVDTLDVAVWVREDECLGDAQEHRIQHRALVPGRVAGRQHGPQVVPERAHFARRDFEVRPWQLCGRCQRLDSGAASKVGKGLDRARSATKDLHPHHQGERERSQDGQGTQQGALACRRNHDVRRQVDDRPPGGTRNRCDRVEAFEALRIAHPATASVSLWLPRRRRSGLSSDPGARVDVAGQHQTCVADQLHDHARWQIVGGVDQLQRCEVDRQRHHAHGLARAVRPERLRREQDLATGIEATGYRSEREASTGQRGRQVERRIDRGGCLGPQPDRAADPRAVAAHCDEVGVFDLCVTEQPEHRAAPRRVQLLHVVKTSQALQQRAGALEFGLRAMSHRASQALGLLDGLLGVRVKLLHRPQGNKCCKRQRGCEHEPRQLQAQRSVAVDRQFKRWAFYRKKPISVGCWTGGDSAGHRVLLSATAFLSARLAPHELPLRLCPACRLRSRPDRPTSPHAGPAWPGSDRQSRRTGRLTARGDEPEAAGRHA